MRAVFAIKSMNTAGGGAERVLAEVVSGLVQRGHDLTLVTFDGPGASFYPLAGGVPRIDLDVGAVGQPVPRADVLKSLPRLRRTITSLYPDVVVGFMHSMFVPLGLALIGSRLPVIASEHASAHYYRTVAGQRSLLEIVPYVTVASTIPSEAGRAAFPARLRHRMVVVPNPIVSVPAAATGGQLKDRGKHLLLSVGRFFPEKNQADLIAAFSRVAADFPDWTLRLAGDGVLRDELERQVAGLGLGRRVQFAGTVRDVASEYFAAGIVIVPSLHESFGLVTAEALAAGRPVVGFADCPGTSELVKHDVNGLLVSGGQDRAGALADGLRRLMADDRLRVRLGQAGPASVAGFAPTAVVDQWEQLLLRCAALRR